jgi:hypothetical protein
MTSDVVWEEPAYMELCAIDEAITMDEGLRGVRARNGAGARR